MTGPELRAYREAHKLTHSRTLARRGLMDDWTREHLRRWTHEHVDEDAVERERFIAWVEAQDEGDLAYFLEAAWAAAYREFCEVDPAQ